jgi:undecaprenyl diphosphate synthase
MSEPAPNEANTSTVVPRHVAVIMDGNGRWAKQRGLSRIKGHQEGAESVRAILRAAQDAGVEYLTLYAFSSENWVRPIAEIHGLMELLKQFLKSHEYVLHENEVRLRTIGRFDDLPLPVRRRLNSVMEKTKHYTKAHLLLALSYGGRQEMVDAVAKIAGDVKAGNLKPEDVCEQTIAGNLYAPDVPDPDLMIRTSGEQRLSNFLLWQLSYAELYFTDVLWPDFRAKEFAAAIEDFQKRKRRFGDVG